jgi:hypothetical protein
VLVTNRNPRFSVAELIDAVADEKGGQALKALLGNPVQASRLMYRAATPFERTLIDKFPDEPIAKLFRYVVLTYADNAARKKATALLQRDSGFEYVMRDEEISHSALPGESAGFFGTSATDISQWGMRIMKFPEAWNASKGRAFVAALDNQSKGVDK